MWKLIIFDAPEKNQNFSSYRHYIEQTTDAENPPDQVRSVEAIAEAYPHESIPVQENGSYDPADDDHNQVIPLDVLNVNEPSPATVAPKKKVQIALEIPDDTVNNADNEAQQNNHQRKPKKPTDTQPQGSAMFFPMSFGESDGGATIAVANAFSDGPGAVRSHAIAYGMPGGEARRRAVARAASAAQRAIGY